MVDAERLPFLEDAEDLAVERPGRVEIGAERLLDHHPTPAARLLVGEARGAEILDDDRERLGRRRQVEQHVALGAMPPGDRLERLAEPAKRGRVVEIPFVIVDPAGQPAPGRRFRVDRADLARAAGEFGAKLLARIVAAADAEHRELLRQQLGARQIDHRGQQQPLGQVAGAAEDHQCRRRRLLGLDRHRHPSRHSARAAASTSSTWPGTLTLRQTRRMAPLPSIRKVARSIPMYVRPYMLFSTQVP